MGGGGGVKCFGRLATRLETGFKCVNYDQQLASLIYGDSQRTSTSVAAGFPSLPTSSSRYRRDRSTPQGHTATVTPSEAST